MLAGIAEVLRGQCIARHRAIVAGATLLPYGGMNQLVEEVKTKYASLTKGLDRLVSRFERVACDAERRTSQVVHIMHKETGGTGMTTEANMT